MASEVHEFPVIVPAATALAAPLTFPLSMPPRIVEEIQVQVPPGPRGEVGWAVAQAGVPILPQEPGAWIVTDSELVRWPLEQQNTSGAWQLIAYNTGQFNHTIYVRFLTRLPAGASSDAAGGPPLGDLLPSPDAAAPPPSEDLPLTDEELAALAAEGSPLPLPDPPPLPAPPAPPTVSLVL